MFLAIDYVEMRELFKKHQSQHGLLTWDGESINLLFGLEVVHKIDMIMNLIENT